MLKYILCDIGNTKFEEEMDMAFCNSLEEVQKFFENFPGKRIKIAYS